MFSLTPTLISIPCDQVLILSVSSGTHPLKLIVIDSRTLELHWLAPDEPNGRLKEYTVFQVCGCGSRPFSPCRPPPNPLLVINKC